MQTNKQLFFLLIPFVLLTITACSSDDDPTPENQQISIIEPSGLTISPDGETLWIVSDKGWLYKTDTTGKVQTRYAISGDLEGVAYDANNDTLWLAEERTQKVMNYNLDGNFADSNSVTVLPTNDNDGLEGIAVCGSSIFVVQEKNPGIYLELDRDDLINGTVTELDIINPLDFFGQDYSGLACDLVPADNQGAGTPTGDLWAVSHKAQGLYLVNFSTKSAERVFYLPLLQVEGVTYDYQNELVYVIAEDPKLEVYDVSDKRNPVLVSSYYL